MHWKNDSDAPGAGRPVTRRIVAALALAAGCLWMATPASAAGVYYKAVTDIDAGQGGTQRMVAKTWIDGTCLRVEFEESTGNPVVQEGNYLVSSDGGKTAFMVNPAQETYSTWDIDAMLRFAGSALAGMGGMVKIEISEPEVERLGQDDGGEKLGHATVHHRVRSAYSTRVKVLGMRRSGETETVQDLWVAPALDHLVDGVWLRKEPPKTGNEELDRLIEAEMVQVEGLPLKSVLVSTTTSGRKGKQKTVTRTETEVVEMEEATLTAERCAVPQGYEEVPLLPMSEDEDNPLAGIFGGG